MPYTLETTTSQRVKFAGVEWPDLLALRIEARKYQSIVTASRNEDSRTYEGTICPVTSGMLYHLRLAPAPAPAPDPLAGEAGGWLDAVQAIVDLGKKDEAAGGEFADDWHGEVATFNFEALAAFLAKIAPPALLPSAPDPWEASAIAAGFKQAKLNGKRVWYNAMACESAQTAYNSRHGVYATARKVCEGENLNPRP